VRLRGEISGFRGAHSSGHCYFALKDDKAKISAVIWRSTVQGLKIKPVEGLEVIATGRVTSYPGKSEYQIVIDVLEPAGIGALMALLEERKKRLAAEGLFDEAKKKKIPYLPRVVGLVTSPTGAVIRDMLAGFTERFPAHVVLWPVRVQGESCAAEVAAAIRGFDAAAHGAGLLRPDVLIVARGGGSLEDLWGFNEEIVVRAAASCRIPLISAVGHESDWTLLDLVADARAPTPTKAAEWAVPKFAELFEQIGKLDLRLRIAAHRAIANMRAHLRASARGLPRRQDLLALAGQRFDAIERQLSRALTANTRTHAVKLARCASRLHPRLLAALLGRTRNGFDVLQRRLSTSLLNKTGPRRARLERAMGRLRPKPLVERIMRCQERTIELQRQLQQNLRSNIVRHKRHLDSCAKLLGSLGYHAVLQRGFALVRDTSGRNVRAAAEIVGGQRLDIELADGHVGVEATGRERVQRTSEASTQSKTSSTRTKAGGGTQGSLF
jgi:exodeoxyribonuclease VII large subunit